MAAVVSVGASAHADVAASLPALERGTILWGSRVAPERFLSPAELKNIIPAPTDRDLSAIEAGLASRQHGVVVLDLDYVGRSREGLDLLTQHPQDKGRVIVIIRNGRGITDITLEQLKALGAEVRWDFSALLRHKLERFQIDHGIKTTTAAAPLIGVDASTISAHLNREIGIQSVTLEKLSVALGITPEERACCYNLKLLGMDVERRQEARVAAKLALEGLLMDGKPYPGDHRVLETAATHFKEFSRAELLSVIREERQSRGLVDPYEHLHNELRSLHEKLGSLKDPEWERRRLRQMTGFVLEEMALLQMQISGAQQCSQFCATVKRDEKGEILSTRNILDLVVLRSECSPILWKKLLEMSVKSGRLEVIDSGEIIPETSDAGGSKVVTFKYHPSPKDGSLPSEPINLGTSTARPDESQFGTILNTLPGKAWAVRYRDRTTGAELYAHGWNSRDMHPDPSLGHILSDPAGVRDELANWENNLPYSAIELKKGGGRSASYVSQIIEQLKGQRDAILAARAETPDSVLAQIADIRVMVLENNPELSDAIMKLNETEGKFFSYEQFAHFPIRSVVERLNNGEYGLDEVRALHRFMRHLNGVLASEPTIRTTAELEPLAAQAINHAFRGLTEEQSANDRSRLVHTFLAPLDPPGVLEKSASGSDELMAQLKRYLTGRTEVANVTNCLNELARLTDLHPRLDPNALQQILTDILPGTSDSNLLNPALGARIEEHGRIKTIQRVFARGAGSERLDADIMELLAEYDIEGARIAPDDAERLTKLVEKLRSDVTSRELQIRSRKRLESELAAELLGSKAHRLLPEESDARAGLQSSYAPVGFSPLALLRTERSGPEHLEDTMARAVVEESSIRLIISATQSERAKILGPYAQAVDSVLYDVYRNTTAPAGVTELAMRNFSMGNPEERMLSDSSFSVATAGLGDMPVREVTPIAIAGVELGRRTADFAREILESLDAARSIDQDWIVERRSRLFDLKRDFDHVLEYRLNERCDEVFDGHVAGKSTLPLHALNRAITAIAPEFAGALEELQRSGDVPATLNLEIPIAGRSSSIQLEQVARSMSSAIMRALTHEASALRDSDRRELAAAIVTRAVSTEERMTVRFFDRVLWNTAVIAEISPDLARDYLQSSVVTFLHDPAMYRDHYLAGLETAVSEISTRCSTVPGTLERFADVVQLRSKELGISDSAAKSGILRELVTLHIESHDPLALAAGAISPKEPFVEVSKAIVELLKRNGHPRTDETKEAARSVSERVDAFLRLDTRILPKERTPVTAQIEQIELARSNPHVRRWRNYNPYSNEVRAEKNGAAIWMGPFIRDLMQSADGFEGINEKLWEGLALTAEAQTLSFVAHVEKLRAKRGDREVENLKRSMRRWMDITENHERVNPVFSGWDPIMLRENHFRGFRPHQEMQKLLESFRQDHPLLLLYYAHNTPGFAAFCGYSVR